MRRRWIRRVFAYFLSIFVLPIALLIGGEFLLRAAGCGHSTRPFVEKRQDGETFHVRNRYFIDQFFPWYIPQNLWEPVELVVPREKPRDTYRIFILGESAPEGWPGPECSFSRFLRVMLQSQYPEVHFEVYNTAFRALNSHVMRVEAQSLAHLAPDLFIAYIGNNEVHGPYGPTKDPRGHPIPLLPLNAIRANIWMQDLRLMQGVQAVRHTVVSFLGAKDLRTRWYKDSYTYWNDPRVPAIFDYFRTNLDDICQAGLDAGASIMLCTIPVNLRHWRPVASCHSPDLSPSDGEVWADRYASGKAAEEQKEYRNALDLYEQAAALDPTFADLEYRMGHCLWNLGEFDKARSCFELALEYDSYFWVRSRARTNEVIRETGERWASAGVHLADVKGFIESESPHGCPGDELFFDYCHYNLHGAYLLASFLSQEIAPVVEDATGATAPASYQALSYEECLRRLALSPLSLVSYLETTLNPDKPFDETNTLDEEAREMLRGMLAKGKEVGGADPRAKTLAMYADALRSGTDDYLLRYGYVKELLGPFPLELPAAAPPDAQAQLDLAEAEALASRYPHYRGSLRLLGEAQARAGRRKDVLRTFAETISLYPDDLPSYGNAAATLLCVGQPEVAWRVIRRAPNIEEDSGIAFLKERKACVYAALGEIPKATALLSETIKLAPDNVAQYNVLDRLYADRPQELVTLWRTVLADLEDKTVAYFHLGKAFQAAGDVDGAFKAYRAATQDHKNALFDERIVERLLEWGRLSMKAGDAGTAVRVYREAQAYNPRNVDLVLDEGDALEAAAEPESARAVYERAIRIAPTDLRAYDRLDGLGLERKDASTRVAVWERLASENPEIVHCFYMYAQALEAADRQAEAVDAYSKALTLDPSDQGVKTALERLQTASRYAEGKRLSKAGKLDEAMAVFRECIQANPEVNAPYIDLDDLYVQHNDPEGRVAEWQTLCRDLPQSARAHFYLGKALMAREDLEGAAAALGRAIALDPSDPAAPAALRDVENRMQYQDAKVLEEAGKLSEAAAAYRGCIRLNPEGNAPYDDLDNLYVQRNAPEGRIAEWQALCRDLPDSARAQFCLGKALMASENLEGAAAALGKAIALDPSDPAIPATLKEVEDRMRYRDAKAQEEAGKLSEAAAAYRGCIEANPDDSAAYDALDNLCVQRNDPAGRVSEWQALARVVPQSARVHFCLGKAFEAAGNLPEAVEAYREAATLNPMDPAFQASLGLALTSVGDVQGAVEPFERALELNPDIPSIRVALVAALCQTKDYAAAGRQLNECKTRGIEVPAALVDEIAQEGRPTP